jgi:hypothetical protein
VGRHRRRGAKYWQTVLTEIKNRGVRDVLMLVCDGLTALPEAVNTVWPQTVVQTCIVHLIRSSLRYASRRDWAEVARDLKPVYTAVNEEQARVRLGEFAEKWGKRYPSIAGTWERAWSEFVPFLGLPDAIRQVVYTTNAIVIWSRPKGVHHVVQEVVNPGVLRGGCGYLPPSMTQIFRRQQCWSNACSYLLRDVNRGQYWGRMMLRSRRSSATCRT